MRRLVAFSLALVLLAPALAQADAKELFSSLRRQDRWGGVTVAPVLALPELVVGCAIGHPIDLVAVEVCGGASGALKTLSQTAKFRFDLGNGRDAATGAGTQLTLGPAFGATQLWACPVGEKCGFAAGAHASAALEHLWWQSRHFAFVVEANLGVAMLWTRTTPAFLETMISPVIRLSGGVAF